MKIAKGNGYSLFRTYKLGELRKINDIKKINIEKAKVDINKDFGILNKTKTSYLHSLVILGKVDNCNDDIKKGITAFINYFITGYLATNSREIIKDKLKKYKNEKELEKAVSKYFRPLGLKYTDDNTENGRKFIHLLFSFCNDEFHVFEKNSRDMITKVQEKIERRKNLNKKSIENNKIGVAYSNHTLKQSWLLSFLNKNNVDVFLNVNIDLLQKYEDLCDFKDLFTFENIENKKNPKFSDIRKDVIIFQKIHCNIETEDINNDYFKYYLDEIKTLIEKKFSPKMLKVLLDNKESISKYIKKYTNIDYIKNTVRMSISNKLLQKMINASKYKYIIGSNNINNITTEDLRKMRSEEAFNKQLLTSVSFASVKLAYILGVPTKDLLGSNIFTKDAEVKIKGELKNVKKEIGWIEFIKDKNENEIIKRFYNVFYNSNGIDNEKNKFTPEIFIDIYKICKDIRNNTYHYKNVDNIIEKNNNATKNNSYVNLLFHEDFKNINKNFSQRIDSMKIFDYYDYNQLKDIFDDSYKEKNKILFNITKANVPFAPSFKKLYLKGKNIQKSGENKLLNSDDLYLDFDDETDLDKINAYKNLLKVIYENIFLHKVKTDNDVNLVYENITEITEMNKKTNKKIAEDNKSIKRNENQYKYNDISKIESNNLTDFLEQLQSLYVISENDEEKNKLSTIKENDTDYHKYIEFVQDLFAYSFNKYIKNNKNMFDKIKSYKEKQELTADNRKNIIDDFSTIINVNAGLDNFIFYNFYAYLKLLDKLTLSRLSGEFKSYCQFISKYKDKKYTDEYIQWYTDHQNAMALAILSFPINDTKDNVKNEEDEFYQKRYEKLYGEFIEGGFTKDNLKKFDNFYKDGKNIIEKKSLIHVNRENMFDLYAKMLKDKYKITVKDYEKYKEFKNGKIEELHKERDYLHKEYVKLLKEKREKSSANNKLKIYFKDNEKYKICVEKIAEYDNLKNKLEFQDLSKLYVLHNKIVARLVGYAYDFERDLFHYRKFVKKDSKLFKFNRKKEEDSYIECAIREVKEIDVSFEKLFFNNIESNTVVDTRDNIAHINLLTGGFREEKKSIIDIINDTRDMMSYDRKRKNAVTSSIIELFEKENIILKFKNDSQNMHNFVVDSITSNNIIHLSNSNQIIEVPVHSEEYIELVKLLLNYKFN